VLEPDEMQCGIEPKARWPYGVLEYHEPVRLEHPDSRLGAASDLDKEEKLEWENTLCRLETCKR
jgi:hypothetical protein